MELPSVSIPTSTGAIDQDPGRPRDRQEKKYLKSVLSWLTHAFSHDSNNCLFLSVLEIKPTTLTVLSALPLSYIPNSPPLRKPYYSFLCLKTVSHYMALFVLKPWVLLLQPPSHMLG